MKKLIATALLSLCVSSHAFYVLVDAGPADWLEGNRVEQVSVELSNGDPAIPGELARSRQPFDAANLKAVDGQIVAMTASEIAARDAAEAQAAQDAAAQSALYEDPQPAVFVPRISGTITNVVGESQVFVDDTGEVFAVDETGSPEHTLKQKQSQADARKAIIATAKTAKGKGNKLSDIAERVAALEALNGIK